MEPFKVADSLKKLAETYPSPKQLLKAAYDGGSDACAAIAQLWIAEGIPYAFYKCPAIYESVRAWLSVRLDVNPRDVCMNGSARFGASLVISQFGKKFDRASDLDFLIISSGLFDKLKNDFYHWSHDYKIGNITPKTRKEKEYWPSNHNTVPVNINQGFIDAIKIPNYTEYPTAQQINNVMSEFVAKLGKTDLAPSPKKASVRCYRSWENFIQRASFNLLDLAEKAEKKNLL